MKTLLVIGSLALAGVSSVQAQTYQRSGAVPGSLLGAIAGAFIGGHNNDRWAEGAALGGITGALLGAAVSPQQGTIYQQQQAPVVYTQSQAPVVYSQQGVVQPTPMGQTAPATTTAPVVTRYQ